MVIPRVATPQDLPRLHALDELCFPPGDLARKPAALNELEHGVAKQWIQICEVDNEIVSFIQLERPTKYHLYISALAVHPDYRDQGLATSLLDPIIRSEPETGRSISVVTAPDNYQMLGLLLSRGFIARTIMKDYFGPGAHRLYLQYKSRTQYVDPDERFIVPATASDHLSSLLQSDNQVVTAVFELPSGYAFEVSRFEREDLSELQSGEGMSGVSFSGSILAAITFVLGISFTSPNYPDEVRILLMGAAFASLASLTIYANAAGELSRIRSNKFSYYMKWGNVLSEYGGVLPFLISLPVTFAEVTHSSLASLITSGASSVALFLYLRSPYSMSTRFSGSVTTWALQVYICLAPVAGVATIKYLPVPWLWTAATVASLIFLSCIYLFMRQGEVAQIPQQRWPSRQITFTRKDAEKTRLTPTPSGSTTRQSGSESGGVNC
jgi:ribosomal protein S18 acetylase RimI-like enzyme